jgi:lipopolysaccharide/colanic/teichoic acid biosynthesis glycosyltransferase
MRIIPPAKRRQTGVNAAMEHEVVAREPVLKRPFDFVLSSLGLLLSSPLWPLIALAIKLEDGGPVFYAQRRWGRGAREIRVWKFRTMVADADARFGRTQAGTNDPRVTRTGRVLRRMGLDELPQLLSIWRGEMSLVGPRALAVGETYVQPDGTRLRYDEVPGFAERLRVRPGLTGLATIYLAKDADPAQRFAMDGRYVREQSFLLDLKLVVLSLVISLLGRWEHRGRKV